MARILLFLLLVFLLVALTYALRKKLRDKLYHFFIIFFIIISAFMIGFELFKAAENSSQTEHINAFFQGQSLMCKDINVSTKDFNFEYGTKAFISNDKNESLKNLKFSIKDCH